jgi:hypothetical protein
VTTVRITGRVQEYDGETDDDGAMRAERRWRPARAGGKGGDQQLRTHPKIQKYAEVRSTINVDADGEAHMGQLLFEIDIEHYQGRKIFILSTRLRWRDRYHRRNAGRHAAPGRQY